MPQVKPALVTAFGPPPTLDELAKFKARDSGGKPGSKGVDGNDGGNDDDPDGSGSGSKSGAAVLKSAEDALLESISAAVSARAGRSAAAAGGEGGGAGEAGATALLPGDSVVVVRGDLQNLSGRVVALNPGGTFTLQPSAESAAQLGLNERLELQVCDY